MKPQTGTQNWLKPPNRQTVIDPLIESSDSNIKKLMASAVLESTKKSPKYVVNVFEVKKFTSRLLIFSPT